MTWMTYVIMRLLIEVILNLLIAAFKFMSYNCDVTSFPLFVYFAVHFILKVRYNLKHTNSIIKWAFYNFFLLI